MGSCTSRKASPPLQPFTAAQAQQEEELSRGYDDPSPGRSVVPRAQSQPDYLEDDAADLLSDGLSDEERRAVYRQRRRRAEFRGVETDESYGARDVVKRNANRRGTVNLTNQLAQVRAKALQKEYSSASGGWFGANAKEDDDTREQEENLGHHIAGRAMPSRRGHVKRNNELAPHTGWCGAPIDIFSVVGICPEPQTVPQSSPWDDEDEFS